MAPKEQKRQFYNQISILLVLLLLTCTPYGINSHRLLVRGQRINTDAQEKTDIAVTNEVNTVDYKYLIPVSLFALIALAFVVLVIFSGKKKKQ